jgi:hypothetical protein
VESHRTTFECFAKVSLSSQTELLKLYYFYQDGLLKLVDEVTLWRERKMDENVVFSSMLNTLALCSSLFSRGWVFHRNKNRRGRDWKAPSMVPDLVLFSGRSYYNDEHNHQYLY